MALFTRRQQLAFVAFAGAALAASAQSPPATAASANSAPTLAPVVVTGELPGPALWKVSKGDHVMWILGLVSPVPLHVKWKFKELDADIAASQAVLTPPALTVGAHVGFFSGIRLLPSVSGIKKNPDSRVLQEVLPSGLYQRWRVQKDRYLYGDGSVEHLRPVFAGGKLYEAALRHIGLVDQAGLEKTIYKMAHRHGVPIVDSSYQITLSDPGSTIHALKQDNLGDQRCLDQVLDVLEHDLAQTTERANAWATGDIATLKAVLAQTQEDHCLSDVATSPFAKELGLTDLQRRIDRAWIEHAEQALQQNAQTVALLPMDELFEPSGYLSALEADGYTVRAPEQ
jgi:hypothetical protein